MSTPILEIEDLHVHFENYAGTIHAVNGMSFSIQPGEIYGLVGESGCGKSVTALAALRMVKPPGYIAGGRIRYHGEDLLELSEERMHAVRGGGIAMVFQDPFASLNPVFTVGDQTNRIIRRHLGLSQKVARAKAVDAFDKVGLPDPETVYDSYPFHLSGGMQQRVMIAMGLSSGADLLIADEPTTALDVTIQAQILKLLTDLRETENLAILLITHDLGVVAETCDRVGVAYAGHIVETGTVEQCLYTRGHPYTDGLLGALPDLVEHGADLEVIDGSVPDGLETIPGCPFHPRCPHVMDVCRGDPPPFYRLGEGRTTHAVACYLYGEHPVIPPRAPGPTDRPGPPRSTEPEEAT